MLVVSCRMVCEERVVYEQGSDTRTDTAKVFAETFTALEVKATADGLEASVQLEVPAWTGAPTFDLGKNSVQLVRDRVGRRSWPPYPTSNTSRSSWHHGSIPTFATR